MSSRHARACISLLVPEEISGNATESHGKFGEDHRIYFLLFPPKAPTSCYMPWPLSHRGRICEVLMILLSVCCGWPLFSDIF